MKIIMGIAATAALVTTVSTSMVTPVLAKAYCVYAAEDTSNRRIATAGTHRKKMSKACERARKKCNFQREYWGKRGKFGRSHGCLKIASQHK